MQICPNCNYERKPSDGDPDWQCPGCGVAYCKAAKINLTQHQQVHPRKNRTWLKLLGLMLIVLAALAGGLYRKIHQPKPPVMPVAIENQTTEPAASLAKDPIQTMVEGKIPAFERKGYSLTPLASFELEAKVLSRENYWLGRTADLSPTDLALGWGVMATENMLSKVRISQNNRWFFWRVNRDFTPEMGHEISSHASNMHIIPATPEVEQALSSVKTGQIVYIKGYLMEANAKDGWKWRSSLSREDTGDGACELLWADDLRVK